jgi:hypothetical protein
MRNYLYNLIMQCFFNKIYNFLYIFAEGISVHH